MMVSNLYISRNRPSMGSSINDNYCISPTDQTPSLMLDDYHQKSQVHVSFLNVLTPVHFVDLKGLLQK